MLLCLTDNADTHCLLWEIYEFKIPNFFPYFSNIMFNMKSTNLGVNSNKAKVLLTH